MVPEAMSMMLTPGDVFVGDVELLAVLADVEVLGIGAAGDDLDELSLRDVEDSDAVGALVGRRQGALVDVGTGDGGSAQRDIESLFVGARVNSARTFSERHGGEKVEVAAVDDAEIAGDLVGDVDLWRAGFGGGCCGSFGLRGRLRFAGDQ